MKRSFLTLLALVALGAGCSVYQPMRDTTQPMKLKKSALLSSDPWYMLTTVIDAPYEAAFTFPGEASDMQKVKWVIEKDFLYAYRAHEFIRGTEFAEGQDNFLGEPVAAYRIESHFDVWRQYNPVTGEEIPILYEARENPWWEREWIRVDWSQNMISGFNWMFSEFCKLDGNIVADPVPFYGTQPDDPEQFYVGLRGKTEADLQSRPWYADFQKKLPGESFCKEQDGWCNVYDWDRIEFLDDQDKIDYIDVVGREIVHVNIGQWLGDGNPNVSCVSYPNIAFGGGMQVTYRYSFMKKAPTQFKPVYHPDRAFEKFGFFRLERDVFDPERRVTDFKDYYAQIWNLFDNRYNADGTEKPVDDWKLRPITYYYVPKAHLPSTKACERDGTSPDEGGACVDYIRDDSYDQVAADWNEAFRDTLRALGRADAEDAVLFSAKPIEYTCGVSGDRPCQDIGDLRYSFMWNHDLVFAGSPLGYGPSFADPETGEIIATNANFYGGALRSISGYLSDLYDVSKGNTSELEIMTGENIREYFENLGGNVIPPRLPRVYLDDLDAMMEASTDGRLDKTRSANLSFKDRKFRKELLERDRLTPRNDAQRAKIIGTPLEKMLIVPELLALNGLPGDVELTEDVLDRVSPLRHGSKDREDLDAWSDFWMKKSVLRAEGIFSDFALENVIEWAETALGKEGVTPNRRTVVDFILRQTFRGVEDHEVGHTMGLRHNFQGSFDEENYRTEYWDIQSTLPDIDFGTMDGKQIISSYDANGDRQLDASELAQYQTDKIARKREQERAGVDMYTFSSIMDYSAHFYYNDVVGLSRFDHAALKFGYGNKIELYSQQQSDFDSAQVSAVGGWDAFKFRKLNRINIDYYLGGERCSASSECPHFEHSRVPQHCYSGRGVGSELTSATGTPDDLGVCASIYDELEILQANAPTTPLYPDYDFCSDERRQDRAFCNVYDEGKSAQEIVENLTEDYQRNYIFNNFRRYRDSFSPYFYANRIWSRYFFPIGKIYQTMLYGYYYKDGFSENMGPGGFLDSFLASRVGMNFFAQIISTPDVGSYLKWDPADKLYDGPYGEEQASFADVFAPAGIGKYLYSVFEIGYFGEIYRYARIGNFYDKLLAIEALTTRYWGQPQANDETFPINYYDGFQDEMLDFFGSLVSEDFYGYSPLIRAVDPDGAVTQIEYRDLWQGGFFGGPTADFNGLEAVTGQPTPASQRYQGEVFDAGGSIYVRIYSLLYALIDFPVFYDQNFPSYAQLYVYGRSSAREQQAITDGEAAGDLIAFRSPDRDLTFVVPQTRGNRSLFYRAIKKAKDEAVALEQYRTLQAAGSAPAGFAAAHQICGKVYGINPNDPGADDECLTQLTDRQESRLESEESYLRIALDFLNQLDYPTQ